MVSVFDLPLTPCARTPKQVSRKQPAHHEQLCGARSVARYDGAYIWLARELHHKGRSYAVVPAESRRCRFSSTLGHLTLSRFLVPLAIDITMLLLSVFQLALRGAFFPAESVARTAGRVPRGIIRFRRRRSRPEPWTTSVTSCEGGAFVRVVAQMRL